MNETDRFQMLSRDGIDICSFQAKDHWSRTDGREDIHRSLNAERTQVSRSNCLPRFFKLTGDGQWERKSRDGKYKKLSTSRLLKRLQVALSRQAMRMTTE